MAVLHKSTVSSVPSRSFLEERVRLIFERRSAGDVEGMMEFASPDLVYKGVIHAGQPLGLSRQGKSACIEFGQAMNVFFEYVDHRIDEMVIDGDRVALKRTARLRNRGSGVESDVAICNFLTFRDGLMIAIEEYPDTQAVASLGGWP